MSQKSETDLIKTIANIVTVNLLSLSEKTGKPMKELVNHHSIITLAKFFDEKKINNQGLAKALELLIENPDKMAEEIVQENNLLQVNDDTALQAFVDLVIQTNPKPVEEYKSGKVQVIGFLVGQCMQESKGKGNPQKFTELLKKKLEA
jgi:aspartyl-tRNA(Asn)/glutamyl-tRNA(Gln) amidotransferase subunit B